MFKVITLLMASAIVAGCAKTSISTINHTSASLQPRPTRVLIQNFTVASQSIKTSSSALSKIKAMITDESSEKAKQELSAEVTDALSKELSKRINALGLTTGHAELNYQPAQDEIIISGNFSNIDEGNAAKRNLIGLGAGQSSLDSHVKLLSASSQGVQEILSFNAHSDSGNMPGAAVMGPAGLAAGAGAATVAGVNVAKGAASAYKSNSANQASDLADKIAETLSKYFVEQGWIQ